MASIKKRTDGVYRARYRDHGGREHAKHFTRKTDAQKWLDTQTASLVRGDHVDPKTAKTTVAGWCQVWLDGYGTRRPTTVRQAKTHIALILAEFGDTRLGDVRPSQVKAWTTKLSEQGYAASYVYATYRRLSQVYTDAVADGIVPRNPCSRRTSPPAAKQRPYVATSEQVWRLYEEMPERLRVAIELGAFVGLRCAEACGLRVADIDFMRGIVRPAVQYPAEELKTEMSKTPIPIPSTLALRLSAHVAKYPAATLLSTEVGGQVGPWMLERAMRSARARVEGLPEGFRFQDLRHFFASLLIDSNANIKVVQTRLRHASAKTTLDTYGHMFPDQDEATRAAVERALVAGADYLRTREVVA